MYKCRKSPTVRLLALLLVIIFIVPVCASAASAVTPRASYYLDSYNTYIYPAAFGKIQVWFSVTGITYMDDIGVLNIQIYESTDQTNWTWVDTFKYGSYSRMLGHDDYYHSGYIEYQGTIGRYYHAYVTIWAGKDGGGDTRYMWTQPKKATLLPG